MNPLNLITIKQFCNLFSVAKSTAYNLIAEGMPSIKTKGLGRRIDVNEATKWLLEHKYNIPTRKGENHKE